jgi:spore germination protein GerM
MAQAKKPGAKRSGSGTQKSRSKKSAAPPVQQVSSNRAFYILVIIILITVIVLLVNRYAGKGTFEFPVFKTTVDPVIIPGEKKSEDKPRLSKPDELKDDKTVDTTVKDKTEAAAPQENVVAIYLLKLNEKTEKIYLTQVKRKVKGDAILESAIESLIKGPNASERNRGYITAVPASLRLRRVNIKGSTAELDFSGEIEQSAAGEIVIKRVQQIVYTATQFDNVDSIVIMINGQRRKTLGSDGFSISGPLRR